MFAVMGALLLTLTLGVQFYHQSNGGSRELPVLGRLPSFEFTNQNGDLVSSEIFSQSATVVNFFFTRCQGICPALNGRIATLYRRFRGQQDLSFSSISVDPERDTPEVLSKYAEKFSAEAPKWQFLTGSKAAVQKFIEGIKLNASDTPDNHTTRVLLVDHAGQIRGYYRGLDDESMDSLAFDLQNLNTSLGEDGGLK